MDGNRNRRQNTDNGQKNPNPAGNHVGDQGRGRVQTNHSARPDPNGQNRPSPSQRPLRPSRPAPAAQDPSRRVKQNSGLKDNLRSQTPLNRKLRQQTASPEPGTERRTSTPQYFRVKQDAKKKGKRGLSFPARCIILGVVAYLLILPITLFVFSLMLPPATSKQTNDYVYQLGSGRNVVSRKVYPYSRLRRGDIFYIEMDSLADYCDLTTTGDSERMRYVVKETGESVEFVIGQNIAYINGVSERTGGDCLIIQGKVYIPLEFAKRCFIGIEITLDTEENKITIVRLPMPDGSLSALSFPYKLPDTSDSINFGELDADIQEMIIMQNQPSNPDPAGD